MSLDLPGFSDAVLDAQSCFRAVLSAMSCPGTIQAAGVGLTPPAPLAPAMAAVLLTLTDVDTSLHLAKEAEPARDWLAFHAGTPFAASAAEADFCVAFALPDLAPLKTGSDDAPEAGTTVILDVAALGIGSAWRISGPGLAAPATLRVTGLPHDFAAIWAANHALYPRGVDLILCVGETLAALPRSLTVEEI